MLFLLLRLAELQDLLIELTAAPHLASYALVQVEKYCTVLHCGNS